MKNQLFFSIIRFTHIEIKEDGSRQEDRHQEDRSKKTVAIEIKARSSVLFKLMC